MLKKEVFVCSKVNGAASQALNLQIDNILKEFEFSTYLPQKKLPLDAELDALVILGENEKAVDRADIVLVVFDNIGTGGAMEAERAYLRDKLIIGYRSAPEHLGQMLEGFWRRIPDKYKATNFRELENILFNIKKYDELCMP